MQKKIIALAIAAAFAAPVTAMADAALYGTFDAGYRFKHAQGANGTSGTNTNGMDMRGLYASNAWGFKGSEDLGDGMKALVQFEADFIPGTATGNGQTATYQGQLFDRQLTAGLSGSFGTAQVGYDYTAAFKINRKFDPMNYNFVTSLYSSTSGVIASRNYLVDYTNKFGDISVDAQYVMDNADTASNTVASVGQGRALAVDYAAGPISVGVSYSSQDSSVQTGTNLENPVTLVTAGAGFNYGDGIAKIGYAKKTTKAGTVATGAYEATDTSMWLGANYNVSSKIGATLAYYKNTTNAGSAGAVDVNKAKLIGMVTYAMSKNTTAYVGAERESAETLATGSTTALSADSTVTNSTSVGLAIKF